MSVPASILLVEDDPDFAMAVHSILVDAGYEISGVARSCTDALALASEQRPDLAILDFNLEDNIDGVTLGFELAASGIPIIYLTGEITVTIQRAYEIASDFLEKPVRKEDLLSSVEGIFANGAANARNSPLSP